MGFQMRAHATQTVPGVPSTGAYTRERETAAMHLTENQLFPEICMFEGATPWWQEIARLVLRGYTRDRFRHNWTFAR